MSRISFDIGTVAAKARAEVNRALYAAGNNVEIDAEVSITEGSISGKGHIPSLPGQPPNADSRQLDGSIETRFAAELSVEVAASAPYAAALEYGTEKMDPRPFMRPALEANKEQTLRLVEQAMKRATS